MIERFLRYSLENKKKICVMLMQSGQIEKKNLLVTAIDADGQGFTAKLAGRRRETHMDMADVLTCAYARGDQGELEAL
ncbi:MAG: hypothetical protein U0J65_06055 [Christensenellales bacterium]|nr:hypothetical protein [Christensenellales bacterium]